MQEWADPDSLLNRGELACTISRQPALRDLDPRALLDVVDVPSGNALHNLLADNSIPSALIAWAKAIAAGTVACPLSPG